MGSWQQDKKWSDRFIPEITSHLGQILITEPPAIEDMERNSDLMVFGMDSVRIGCRIRTHSYLENYANEFTIRSGRPSGVKTELTKILEGWGDYFFYGFSNESETALQRWFCGDLKVFRIWFNRELTGMDAGSVPGYGKVNYDGSSSFKAFHLRDLPKDFIVARSGKTETIRS